MSSRSLARGFLEKKGWRKRDSVVKFPVMIPISQNAIRATMDPLDIMIKEEERKNDEEREEQEYVVYNRCIVPISSGAIEATMDPQEIFINREFCLAIS